MNKQDFSRIMQAVIDQCPDGEYDPVYLTLGFLASALENDPVQSALIKHYNESELMKDRMNHLTYLLNDIIDRATPC